MTMENSLPEKLALSTYPNIDELLEAFYRTHLTLAPGLVTELEKRYAEHGGEYATEERHEDGRVVNACMTADSFQDIADELVDAMFNALVCNFRHLGKSLFRLALIQEIGFCWFLLKGLQEGDKQGS